VSRAMDFASPRHEVNHSFLAHSTRITGSSHARVDHRGKRTTRSKGIPYRAPLGQGTGSAKANVWVDSPRGETRTVIRHSPDMASGTDSAT
jgi:hypothetical protein